MPWKLVSFAALVALSLTLVAACGGSDKATSPGDAGSDSAGGG